MNDSSGVFVAECLGGPLDGDRLYCSIGDADVGVMRERETGRIAAVAVGARPRADLYERIGRYELTAFDHLAWYPC